MKMMLPDVIGHENQSQHNQHHRCLCLDLSGQITTPHIFSYHTGFMVACEPMGVQFGGTLLFLLIDAVSDKDNIEPAQV